LTSITTVATVLFLASTSGLPTFAAVNAEAGSSTPGLTPDAVAFEARSRALRSLAATAMAEAARLREDLSREKASIAINWKAPENPWWRKARNRYEPLIGEAEARAAEAVHLSEYYRFRAMDVSSR
jgi:hypothetical protein